ncbi:ABC transporter substrate-binding protein [uncultured Vibrio sp.]|uniref:substrate-binding periplasmic protein n=1 Tax=uncultured Vibrio sp. TaxID=114054 RepID=UPI0025D63704|nr:transporter substrate-binding domain-containing protein [uncultured Vibrio sp.]
MRAPFVIIVVMTTSLWGFSLRAETLNLVTLDYPPYSYQDGNQIEGIATQVVREAFNRINQPISIQVLPWSRALHYIKIGKADAIFTAFKNDERESFADYSKEVLFDQNITFLTTKDNDTEYDGDFKTISQKTICVVNKISYGVRFDQAIKGRILKSIVTTNSAKQCARMLAAGRVDMWVNNQYGAMELAKSLSYLSKLKVLEPPVQSTPSYIAFSKKRNLNDVRDKFDVAIKEMKQDGTFSALIEDYFNQ